MTGVVPRARAASISSAANSRQEIPASKNVGNIPPNRDWFMLLAHGVWGVAAPVAVEEHTGRSDRTCRDWTSGRTEPPAHVVAILLRSREGYLVLRHIMAIDPPTWWIVLQAEIELARLAKMFVAKADALTWPASSK